MIRRILYLHDFVGAGTGAGESLLSIVPNMDRDKFKSLVVLPSKGPLGDMLSEMGVDVTYLPLSLLNRIGLFHNPKLRMVYNPLPYLKTVRGLCRLIKRENIDLVYSNLPTCNQYGAVAAKLAGVPAVCHIRGIYSRTAQWKMLLPLADRIIANSRATADSLVRTGRDPKTISVVYNSYDSTQGGHLPDGEAIRRELGVSADCYLLVMAGRIVPPKGHDILIRALATVECAMPDYCLLVVGDDESQDPIYCDQSYLASLRHLTNQLGLGRKVLFTGLRTDMSRIYAAADVVVSASYQEGFGRTLLEGSAVGKPVIATAVGGCPEVVKHHETGLLVAAGDPEALAEAIIELWRNKEWAGELGRNGQRWVKAQFSRERMLSGISRVFDEVLDSK